MCCSDQALSRCLAACLSVWLSGALSHRLVWPPCLAAFVRTQRRVVHEMRVRPRVPMRVRVNDLSHARACLRAHAHGVGVWKHMICDVICVDCKRQGPGEASNQGTWHDACNQVTDACNQVWHDACNQVTCYVMHATK